ncbi:regulatory protein RecX [Microbacterium sp. No. 7]|uniref:regulatory protein RecX n=1 Tax=Microbacterium sp. No. 7 TaxID=1714373 RepID=UPI001E607CB9|nr:regulatory protein RecX [Microbacterium sp. No. 7]
MAPVIPLFGASRPPQDAREADARTREADAEAGDASPRDEPAWHASWIDDVAPADVPEDRAELVDEAEQLLLKKLRTRSLSVREARAALTQAGLDAAEADALVERFLGNGYLDDAALAEQLMHKAVARKAQGGQAIAQSLAQRGIPRDVIDAALAELPDDESDRALEFARTKARGMTGLDRDVALRRLAGQLARRGFGSSALSAARQALDEQVPARRPVRFE